MIVGLSVARRSKTATCISMGSSSNFIISADVLDISRKATVVKERADFIDACIPLHKIHVSPAASLTANVC